jgi:hypothetical protein
MSKKNEELVFALIKKFDNTTLNFFINMIDHFGVTTIDGLCTLNPHQLRDAGKSKGYSENITNYCIEEIESVLATYAGKKLSDFAPETGQAAAAESDVQADVPADGPITKATGAPGCCASDTRDIGF